MKPTVTTAGITIGTYVRYNTLDGNDIYVVDGIRDFDNVLNIHLSDIYENGFWLTYDPSLINIVDDRYELEDHYKEKAKEWEKNLEVNVGNTIKLVRLAGVYKCFGSSPTIPITDFKPYLNKQGKIIRIYYNYDVRVRFDDGAEFNVPFFCLKIIKPVIAIAGDSIDITPLTGLCNIYKVIKGHDSSGTKILYTYRIDYVCEKPLEVIKEV